MAEAKPFEFELEVTQSGVGDTYSNWVLIPHLDPDGHKIRHVNCTLMPKPTGTGRLEFTNEPERDVLDDPASIQPVIWPAGDVDYLANDGAKGFTAFRVVAVSGTVRAAVRSI